MTSYDQRLRNPASALLVIEQPALAEVVKLALNHGHYSTRAAQTVEDAAAALTRWRPHLAVVEMDIAGNAILDRLRLTQRPTASRSSHSRAGATSRPSSRRSNEEWTTS